MSQTVKVGFVKPQSFLGRCVAWFTWSQYSHVYIQVDGDVYDAYPFKGVRRSTLNEYELTGIADVITLNRNSKESIYKLRKHLSNQIGRGYDYLGIVGFLFRRDWHNNKRWFCSEYVAHGLESIGAVQFKHTNRITPNELYLVLSNNTKR